LHPTNDPNLPSYLHPDAADYQGDLQMLLDCWNGLRGCERQYLPQETKEPRQAHAARVKRTTFDNRYKPAIKDYAGILSVFLLNKDAPKSVNENKNNIDQMGNDLWTFLNEADQMALRDAWCVVLVEFPKKDKSIQSNDDFLQSKRRPYLVIVERQNVINWEYSWVDGKPILSLLVIREIKLERISSYGHKLEIYYRVLTPGMHQVFQLVETERGKYQVIQVDETETTLLQIPAVYYSVESGAPFSATAPLMNLAQLNLEHYRKRSDLSEILHKCNLPVPVRKGLIRGGSTDQPKTPLIIGPNSYIDLPHDGDFYFAEPTGSAIASSREDLKDLEAAMDRVTLDFLTGGNHQKTATETVLDSTKTSANLKGMARRKESAVQQIFQVWTEYTKESSSGGIDMDESLLQMPISPEQVARLTELATAGWISQRTLLLMLQQGKVLSRQLDIDAEVALTQQEKPENEVLSE
jgi:hypothetical protein